MGKRKTMAGAEGDDPTAGDGGVRTYARGGV
jgi:hypothetical protein